MRGLARLLSASELFELAPLCATASAGRVEALINQALARVSYRDDPERWFRLDSLKMSARNIRKWGIEP